VEVRNTHDVKVYRDQEDDNLTDKSLLLSISQMRIMEKSNNRILLQDWDEDEETCEPISHYGLILNYKDNQVFNCILSDYEKGENFVFLNDSEIEDRFYTWMFDQYNPNKNGVITERLMSNHSIKWTFVNNQKHGEWKAISPHGIVTEIGNYKFGKPDGEYKELYGNGQIRHSWNYVNGRRNGISRYYNREGFLTLEGNFLNDKQVGKWVKYNDKGEFESFEDFGEKGKPVFFKDCTGAGIIVCRDCGHQQEIKAHLHSFAGNLKKIRWTRGYQCQTCGKFHVRVSTPEQREITDLTCECGGNISNEEPLFCSKCKSLDLEYRVSFMT